MTALLLLAALGLARADDRVDFRLWSWSRVEALPDLQAEGQLRASQTLRLDLRLPGGWQVDAMGGVRDPAVEPEVEPDLYRLSLRQRGAWYALSAGRIARLGSRGAQRLDGLALDLGADPRLGLALWGGRLWHPESWEVGTTAVGGVELRGQPLPSRRLDLALGYEARVEDEVLDHRAFGHAALRAPAGARVALLAEVDPTDDAEGLPAARASVRAGTPLGRHADLAATARWEDLPSSTTPAALVEPTAWLGGVGYGAVEGEGRLHLGPATLSASGGPTRFAPDEGTGVPPRGGGRARAGADLALGEAAHVGVAGVHAAVDRSWIRGGVVEAGLQLGPLALGADAGLFRFQPIAGPLAGVWEARLHAGGGLPVPETVVQDLGLQAWVATGSDRVLAPWARAGLSLVGRLGTLPEELP